MAIEIKRPKNWRKGQTLFNFIYWLKIKCQEEDIFYMEDKKIDRLYKEFLKEFSSK